MILASFIVPALLALPGFAGNSHNHRRHHARTPKTNISKRAFGGRLTYYQTGLGACGGYNNPSDFIVALNTAQYGGGYPGPNCGKHITISYGGKTHDATIVDECPTCDHGDLDLSQSLFEFFAPTSVGVLQAEWWFNDGSGGGGGQQPPPPTTTEAPPPPPTTTEAPPPPPTTTEAPPPPPETTTTTHHEEPTTTTHEETTSTSETTTSSSTSETPTTTSSESSTATSSTESSTSASSTAASSSAALPTATGNSVAVAESVQQVGVMIAAIAGLNPGLKLEAAT
ncbi:hypothetical protein AAF712_001412 [Marasmius tenuissimus]|uniref:RlpA-like double-psi beta-barrel-protein domain-containing protein-containing protein n=1 Tax=Marasmius tenuissimus TaxID=585030 RepID=A0ABR3ADF0_9AGAR